MSKILLLLAVLSPLAVPARSDAPLEAPVNSDFAD